MLAQAILVINTVKEPRGVQKKLVMCSHSRVSE